MTVFPQLFFDEIGQGYGNSGAAITGETYVRALVYLGNGIVLAGTGANAEIWRSTDYGVTWADTGAAITDEAYVQAQVYLGNGIVLAGTGSHAEIWRSTDYGVTWADTGAAITDEVNVQSLVYLGNGIVLAGTGAHAEIWRSDLPPLPAFEDRMIEEYTIEEFKGTGWSNETLKAIKEYVDDLETRLSATRAGYLDNINNVNLATIADISALTATEIAYLNAAISSRSNHAAADVWTVVTRALTDKLGFSLSTAGIDAIADQIWDEIQSGHVDAGSFGEYLDAKVSDIDVIGPGALSCTWTQRDGSGNPMDNVQVWITTDEGGANVIAGTRLTDSSGEVTFMLDAGTYYVWREKGGFDFTNPQSWTVS